ncbi:MAG TPA: CatB-related O-acetyltransferase [Nevskiaceae bacterium]|nr:CatB-related O-acetyltransferase [Nevskiaceae bacterium]
MGLPAPATPLSAEALKARGLLVAERHHLVGSLRFEDPVCVHAHRLKDCEIGAFGYFNAAGASSAYRLRAGRYLQCGESVILGPPEHPLDGFSTHPFAYTRPAQMPRLYELAAFARLAPVADAGPSWAQTVASDTWIGHEVYIGAGSFVRRGLRIGDGAVIGAGSVVTRDVPPYTVVAGNPARVLRLRHPEALVERLLRLQWWQYDLAPLKASLDFRRLEATLEALEQALAEGRLHPYRPGWQQVQPVAGGFRLLSPAD